MTSTCSNSILMQGWLLIAFGFSFSCQNESQPSKDNTVEDVAVADKAAAPEKDFRFPENWQQAIETLPLDQRPGPVGKTPSSALNGQWKLKLPRPGANDDGETHTRHGFEMPSEHNNAVALVQWSDLSWKDVRFDIGLGICPHRGKQLATTSSSTGWAVVHYAGEPVEGQSWFLHINADKNLQTKAGESFKYAFRVFTY
ncbi:MAG: hypothetical protein QNJ97_20910 [Myxococcota bacterium]|nr:hypothetical protein [Myxococcota bacterium]